MPSPFRNAQILAAATLAFALVLAGCGPRASSGRTDFGDGGDPTADAFLASFQTNVTGYQDPADGRRYTAISSDRQLQQIMSRPEVQDAASRALAASIRNVDFDLSDAAGGGKTARVTIRLEPARTLVFEGPIDPSVRNPQILNSAANPRDSLSLVCGDATCSTARFVLREQRAAGGVSNAAFLRRVRQASVRVLRRAGPGWDQATALPTLQTRIEQTPRRRLTTLEVGYGVSNYRLDMPDAGVCPQGRMVETSEGDDGISQLGCEGREAPPTALKATLSGNTTGGAALLRFEEGGSRLFVTIDADRDDAKTDEDDPDFYAPEAPAGAAELPLPPPPPPESPPAVEGQGDPARPSERPPQRPQAPPVPARPNVPPTARPQGSPGAVPENALFNVDPSSAASRYFENARGNRDIREAILDWTSQAESGRRGGRFEDANRYVRLNLERFLTHGRSTVPQMAEILARMSLPPEMTMFTLLESDFLRDPTFPIRRNRQRSTNTASGPWQIVNATATGRIVRLAIAPFLPDGSVNPCDERADWRKATAGAGRYLAYLMNKFRNDPLLSILAYALGEGGAEDVVTRSNQRLDEISQMGVSYWTVMRYHLAPGHGPRSLEIWHSYVSHLAASALIAREPREHGFSLGAPGPVATIPRCDR